MSSVLNKTKGREFLLSAPDTINTKYNIEGSNNSIFTIALKHGITPLA